jgi:hypothetical protein
MPKQKDLKRLVRSRMKKTGESYTSARAQLTRKTPSPSAPASTRGHAALAGAKRAGMSDEAILANTGKTWSQWVHELDAVDATERPHREIARYVHDTYGVSGWWAQAVTVGYERIRGLREIGQRRDGRYEASKSKTFPVSVATLYRAFAAAGTRRKWLPDALTVRKATQKTCMRITWPDGTHVELYFVDKGAEKSQVAIQHSRLAAKADAVRMKAYWADRLDALGKLMT